MKKVIIMGAAGRDLHNFNTYFRDNKDYRVVAFTATQIPDIGPQVPRGAGREALSQGHPHPRRRGAQRPHRRPQGRRRPFRLQKTQEEIDNLWEALSEGGEQVSCGWLKDKYGLTWQIVPEILDIMMRDPDTAKADRVRAAMLGMDGKLNISELEKAYNNAE